MYPTRPIIFTCQLSAVYLLHPSSDVIIHDHARNRIRPLTQEIDPSNAHYRYTAVLLPGVDRSTISSRPERLYSYSHYYAAYCYRYGDPEHFYRHRQPDGDPYAHPLHYLDPHDHGYSLPAGDDYPVANTNSKLHAYLYAIGDANFYSNADGLFYALPHRYANDYIYSF